MTLIVKKFGGTSVGDISRIRNVARLIKNYRDKHAGAQITVVVSAMAGETNRLISLAKSCSERPAQRELDVLVTTGEQVTVALLSMALIDLGIPAKSLLAQQARIATDTRHTNAKILDIDTQRVKEILAAGEVPVVAGFQGVDAHGDLTTLGRGGSDITAVALAAALKAAACYIYTDVEGVFTTDPRVCRQAKLLSKVSHEEMLEMASQGAKVLHPRSVYFAMRYHVPLVVLSTFNPGHGTWIVREEELMEKPVVTGVTYRLDEAKVTVRKLRAGIASVSRIFNALGEHEIFIDMITQTGVTDGTTSISFTVPDEASAQTLEIVQKLVPELNADGAFLERDIAKISVVGVGMRYHSGIASQMFSALARQDIDVQMISTSEIKISVVVQRKFWEAAVRALHETFLEMQPEVALEAAG